MFVLLDLFLLFGGVFMEGDAGAVRQMAEGFLEIPALALHHEIEQVAAFVALPKTAPGLRIREDHEGRGLRVGVERTKARVILPGMAQFHRFRDNIHNVQPGFDLINCGHKFLGIMNYTG